MLLAALLLLPFSATLFAQKQGKLPRTMYITFDHTPLYDSASYLANIVADLRRGDSVQVHAATGKFYRITMETREGYLLVTNVSARRPATRGEAKPDTSSAPATRGEDAPARMPARRRTSAAAGEAGRASMQCQAVTKAGKRCSRMTSDPSGLCWQHKK